MYGRNGVSHMKQDTFMVSDAQEVMTICLVGKMVRWNHGSLGVFQGFSGFPYTIRWWQKSRLSHVPGLGEAWEREPVWVEFSILLGFSGHVGGWFFEPDFVEVVRDSLVFCCNLFCHEGEFWTSLLAKYSLKNWRVFLWAMWLLEVGGSCSMPNRRP